MLDIVRKRIMLLLCTVAVLFILGIAGWQLQEQNRLRLLYKHVNVETCQTAEKLVKLRGEKLSSLAFDYSLWDETVTFVRTRDPEWARVNLVAGMGSYGADALAVYNPSGQKVYKIDCSANPKLRAPDIKSGIIKYLFSKNVTCHFFIQTSHGIFEVCGAKIVRSADLKRVGPTYGYLFAFQIWNSEYLDGIASLINGKASLQAYPTSNEITPGEIKMSQIVFLKALKGWDGHTLKVLHVNRRFEEGDIQRLASRKVIVLLGTFSGVMFLVLALGLSKFVTRPLGLISSAMEMQSSDILLPIEQDSSEFGRLATLIRRFFQQRSILENEIQERIRAEEEARKSEENLSITLNSIADAVISIDVSGVIAGMNPVAEDWIGWKLPEAAGKLISEVLVIINTQTRENIKIPVQQVMSTGEVYHMANHTTLVARDGVERQISEKVAPIRNNSGEITGAVLVFADVTEQYRIQEALMEKTALLDGQLNASLDGILVVDVNQRVAVMNQRFIEIFNVPWDLIDNIDDSELLKYVMSLTRKPEEFLAKVMYLYNHHEEISRDEIELQDSVVLDRYSAPALGKDGHNYGRIWTFRDITDRKLAEKALQESEERMRSLIASMDDLVFVLDKEFVFQEYYQPCTNNLYVKPEMFIGKHIDDIGLPESALETIMKSLMQTLQSGEPTRAEYSLEMHDTLSWFDLQVTSFQGIDDVLAGLTCVVRDITARKQVEEALQKIEITQSAMISNISDVIAIMGADGIIKYKSPNIEKWFGWHPDELVGSYGWITVHPDDLGRIQNDFYTLLSEHNSVTMLEYRYLCKDGSYKPIKLTATNLVNDPIISGVLLNYHDITERKRAEDEIKEKNEELEASYEELIATTEDLQANEKALLSERNFTKALLESIPGFLYVYDDQGNLIRWNKNHETMTGYSADELSHMNISQWYEGEDIGRVSAAMKKVFNTGFGEVEANLLVKGGGKLFVHVNGVRLDIDGKTYLTGVGTDITKRMHDEEEIRRHSGLITSLLDSIPDLIFFKDVEGVYLGCNPSFTEFVGHSREEIIGSTDYDLFDRKVADSFREYDKQMLASLESRKNEEWITYPDGRVIMLDTLKTPYWGPDGTLIGVLGISRDITDRKMVEEALTSSKAETESLNQQLEAALLAAHQHAKEVEFAKEQIEVDAAEMDYQARHDTLTGLPNRLCFSEELASVIPEHCQNNKQCAVLFIDLDKFKMVNDTMGHKAGDTLLIQTAARLGSCLRSADILARMGGDEFIVLLKNIKSMDDTAVVAQRMLEQVSMPFEINGSKLTIGASIGVSIYPDNTMDADGLLRFADTAMYKAKELGRNNCQFFSDEISQENHARIEMERDLRLALERDEFKVYYQPIVDVNTMSIVGAEALLRWDHPGKGMMSPGLFIPVAEETGIIVQIGKMVLETACKQCKTWQNAGYADFEISVNVSPVQLSEMEIISVVHGALSDVGLHPACLKLEVTETVLAKNDNDEVDILSILRSLGLVICLDDFGIGYSSLSRLNNLPIGHMKIDGYFIRNIVHKKKDRAMTESIIVMAHNLGIKVTAEWIEDEAQMDAIKSLKCDYAQGYLISPALSAGAFEKFLSEWRPLLGNTNAA